MRTKAVIAVTATLIIGFILGMLTSAQIRQVKLRNMRSFVVGREFSHMMMEVIQPDDEQRVQIEEVIRNYNRTTRGMQMKFREEFDSVSAAFKKDIDTLLTREQLDRVHAMDARNREMMMKMRRGFNDPDKQPDHRPMYHHRKYSRRPPDAPQPR